MRRVKWTWGCTALDRVELDLIARTSNVLRSKSNSNTKRYLKTAKDATFQLEEHRGLEICIQN